MQINTKFFRQATGNRCGGNVAVVGLTAPYRPVDFNSSGCRYLATRGDNRSHHILA